MEKLGVPAVAIVTTFFTRLAEITAESLGVPDLPIVSVPHPLGGIPANEAQAKADALIDDVVRALTCDRKTGKTPPEEIPAYPAQTIQLSGSLNAVTQVLYEKGWTDGLPIIPPSRDLVEEMLAHTSHPWREVVGELPPQGGVATVERIAVNAVMAGCRPEYFPVVLAGVESIADPRNNMAGWAATTGSNSPLLIVNGPIRDQLGIHYDSNALGAGHQANATIGRAIGLVTRNIGGTVSQVTDMTTVGAAWEFTNCLGENEEALPKGWQPLNVEFGFSGANTVTVKAINSQIDIFAHRATRFSEILDTTAASIVGVNNVGILKSMQVILGVNPEAAALAYKDGWTKPKIQQYLYEKARQPLRDWLRLGDNYVMRDLFPETKTAPDDYIMRMIPNPEEVIIFIAGGLGKHSVWWPGGHGQAVTKSIDKWGISLSAL
jgi:hypothetical protein